MRTTLAPLAACLVLAVTACGGDGDGEAELVTEANAVCAEYRPKLELLPPPVELDDEWAATGGDLADLMEAAVNKLRLLEPPESLEEDYAAWLAFRAEAVSAMREVQTAGNHTTRRASRPGSGAWTPRSQRRTRSPRSSASPSAPRSA